MIPVGTVSTTGSMAGTTQAFAPATWARRSIGCSVIRRRLDALALAEQIGHPFSIAIALFFNAVLHLDRDEPELAQQRLRAAETPRRPAAGPVHAEHAVASSRYVERLLKADRRHPFLDAHAEDGLGEHGNLRGPAYYN
jgi:hypothetical protein